MNADELARRAAVLITNCTDSGNQGFPHRICQETEKAILREIPLAELLAVAEALRAWRAFQPESETYHMDACTAALDALDAALAKGGR